MPPKTLYVLDASGYLYRAYHALSGMTNARGEPTNALFGFIRSIQKWIQEASPTYCVAVFDGPNSLAKRRALYPEYKAHRASMTEDLRLQRKWVMEFCTLSGIPLLALPDVEADDTMASIALWAVQEGAQVFLCTSDKDMAQLVSPHIALMNPSNNHAVVKENDVQAVYGVRPDQVGDWLALTGDASDNVPGVPGLGPKSATALIQEFETLDNILKQAPTIKGKRGTVLQQHADDALLSRALVQLHCDVEFVRDWSFFQMQSHNPEGLQELYRRMQFHSLLKQLAPSQAAEAPQPSHVTLIEDESSLHALIQRLEKAKDICIQVEPSSIKPLEAEVVGIALASSHDEAWYIPFNGKLQKERLVQCLAPLFSNPQICFAGHDIKHSAHALANAGIQLSCIGFDTLVASNLLRAHERQHTLESLGGPLERTWTSNAMLTGSGKKAIPLQQVEASKMAPSCGAKVLAIWDLKEKFTKELHERQLDSLFYDIELPLLSVLFRMERRGVFVDKQKLAELQQQFHTRLVACEEKIYAYAGERFSIHSPKQLSTILFTKHNLPTSRKTATGFSTDAEVLEGLAGISPLAHSILEYRSLSKLLSTYVEALTEEISSKSGRIHPTFQQSGVATGRLSCNNPNLQNIPVRSEEGRMIREAFRPQVPSWYYLGADYSQIELRFLAHFSQDEALLEAFSSGRDIHTHTASLLLQKPMSEVTPEERQRVKAVNFGIIYGQQAYGLARELGISIPEASEFIERYFARYPKVRGYLQSSIEQARTTGYVTTLCGRQRAIPDIKSPNAALRGAAERLAVNTPLQGSAADLIKKAMIAIDHYCLVNRKMTGMIAQIHDELLFELPENELEEMETVVRQQMEHAMDLSIPLIVDIHIGKNWREC